MAEKYLEQAVVTLASAFTENGDAVTASIPDLSGTLTGLGMHIATLNSSLRLVIDRQRLQEENANSMRQRIVELETSCAEAHLRLEVLTNSRDGVVAWSALNPLLEEVARRSEVQSVSERCGAMEERLSETVSRGEMQPFTVGVAQQIDALERRASSSEEKVASLTKNTARRIDELRSLSDELLHAHTNLQQATERMHSSAREEAAASNERVTSQLRLLEAAASDNLGHSMEEIVKCLAKHSLAIEDINSRESRWHESAATTKEVHALRKEMAAIKRETDASAHKVHEAYSKCLSIATLAGAMAHGGRDVGTVAPESSAALSFVGDSLPRGAGGASTVVGGLGGAIPTTLEAQVAVLRDDVSDVRATQLTAVQSSVLHLRTVVEDVRSESRRTDALLRNLLFVFAEGSGSALSKLVGALRPLVGVGETDATVLNGSSVGVAPPLDDYDLAVSYLDKFIRATVAPVLNELLASLTKRQSFLQEEAVAAETERRIRVLSSKMQSATHGETLRAAVTKESAAAPAPDELLRRFRLGIEVADAFSAEKRFTALASPHSKLAVDDATPGVDIMRVENGGLGQRFGLLPGERILSVGGRPVRSAAEFVSILRSTLADQAVASAESLVLAIAVLSQDGSRVRDIAISASTADVFHS